MERRHWIMFMLLSSNYILQTAARPSQNESENSVQYLPFYGGAKGQYLEVIKDSSGATIKESIVPEDRIKSAQIVNIENENLLSKVLAANLQKIESMSKDFLTLHSLAAKTGSLSEIEKKKLKEQLNAIGESSSNIVKLIDEVGDDVNVLYRKPMSADDKFEQDVGEEGVGIDSHEESEQPAFSTLAEANPVGLAVVGASGQAVSRPIATAVSATGTALARPIATAIAGVDPGSLGINFQIQQQKI